MAKMLFELTDDDRASLEVLRVRFGLRSHAETLRTLIRQAADPLSAYDMPTSGVMLTTEAVEALAQKARELAARGVKIKSDAPLVRVIVPKLERKTFNPQPKKKAKK